MTIKKLVIFNITPLTKRDFLRFGGEVLKEYDFDVWFYDFSPVVYPKLHQNCTFPDLYRPENHILLSTKSEAVKAISDLPPDSFVIMDPQFDYRTFFIFQSLSKAKIPYCALSNHSSPMSVEKKSNKIFKILNKIFSLDFIALKKIIYGPKFARLWGIRSPDFCIAGSTLSLEKYKSRYLISNDTEVLWAHSLDYDIYLKYKGENAKATGKQIIYLDPLAPMFKGDALALNYKSPTTVKNFYPSICKFFNHVEKELDASIEIAAHPKSNHPLYPDYFEGRKTLRGDTFGMIQNSKLVMTHMSTSIQFAILLKKPIIFLTTRELENDSLHSEYIKGFANYFGKKPINIDEPLNMDLEKEMYIDEKLYEGYIDLYIKKRGTEELNTWQILTNRINCL